MLVRFHGTRGTTPVSAPNRARYGGNTPCLEILAGDRRIIVDAGTGIFNLGEGLDPKVAHDFDLMFTHYHWDHIQGLPFFGPVHQADTQIRIHGLTTDTVRPRLALERSLIEPLCPLSPDMLAARLYYDDVRAGETRDFDDLHMITGPNDHPGGCLGLRFEWKGFVFVHMTDTECPREPDEFFAPNVALARNADVLVYDTTFTDDEYHGRLDGMKRHGWGHSTVEHALKFAAETGVRRLLLFHHAPEHDDSELDRISHLAREAFDEAWATVDRMDMVIDDDTGRSELIYPKGISAPAGAGRSRVLEPRS